jgi:hypothetical protein
VVRFDHYLCQHPKDFLAGGCWFKSTKREGKERESLMTACGLQKSIPKKVEKRNQQESVDTIRIKGGSCLWQTSSLTEGAALEENRLRNQSGEVLMITMPQVNFSAEEGI